MLKFSNSVADPDLAFSHHNVKESPHRRCRKTLFTDLLMLKFVKVYEREKKIIKNSVCKFLFQGLIRIRVSKILKPDPNDFNSDPENLFLIY